MRYTKSIRLLLVSYSSFLYCRKSIENRPQSARSWSSMCNASSINSRSSQRKWLNSAWNCTQCTSETVRKHFAARSSAFVCIFLRHFTLVRVMLGSLESNTDHDQNNTQTLQTRIRYASQTSARKTGKLSLLTLVQLLRWVHLCWCFGAQHLQRLESLLWSFLYL